MHISVCAQVRITEIMSDPSPGRGLPETEYIEIYALEDVRIESWVLKDGSGKTGVLPDFFMRKGTYRVICSTSNESEFSIYGPVSVETWPVLNNDHDVVMIYNGRGELIDSIYYRRNWHDAGNGEGGVALELVNPFYRCNPIWKSSVHPDGGTPGYENSIYEKGDIPEVTNWLARDKIILWADEPIDTATINHNSVDIHPSPGGLSFNKSLNKIIIKSAHLMDPDITYLLKLQNIAACNGEVIPTMDIEFMPIRKPGIGDLRINELYFNPPPGEYDFVELINISAASVSLAGITLKFEGNRSGSVTIDSLVAIPPNGLVVLAEESTALLERFPAASPNRILVLPYMINMPDNRASVGLLDSDNHIIDEVYYDYLFHHPALPDREGVSLERIVPHEPALSGKNLASASASSGFGTPTNPNSQKYPAGYEVVFKLKEVINEGQPILISYNNLPPGSTLSIRMFTNRGRLLETLEEGYLPGVSGEILLSPEHSFPGNGLYFLQFELLLENGHTLKVLKKIYVTSI